MNSEAWAAMQEEYKAEAEAKAAKKAKKEGEAMMSDEQISIRNFYYSDIYEDGLVERVKKANQETIEYYEEQNKIKEAEISEALSQ